MIHSRLVMIIINKTALQGIVEQIITVHRLLVIHFIVGFP